MIKQVFPKSLLVPVLGPSDYYPQSYTPFSFDIPEEIELTPFSYEDQVFNGVGEVDNAGECDTVSFVVIV